VDNSGTIFNGSDVVSVLFVPTGNVGPTGANGSSSSGGGSSLVYGRITNAEKVSGVSRWNYSVQTYTAGVGGAGVSAYNLFELSNTGVTAYGYSVTDTLISTTNFNIYNVPIGTWVSMEFTNAVSGSSAYWFAAPNRIDGGCT